MSFSIPSLINPKFPFSFLAQILRKSISKRKEKNRPEFILLPNLFHFTQQSVYITYWLKFDLKICREVELECDFVQLAHSKILKFNPVLIKLNFNNQKFNHPEYIFPPHEVLKNRLLTISALLFAGKNYEK